MCLWLPPPQDLECPYDETRVQAGYNLVGQPGGAKRRTRDNDEEY